MFNPEVVIPFGARILFMLVLLFTYVSAPGRRSVITTLVKVVLESDLTFISNPIVSFGEALTESLPIFSPRVTFIASLWMSMSLIITAGGGVAVGLGVGVGMVTAMLNTIVLLQARILVVGDIITLLSLLLRPIV